MLHRGNLSPPPQPAMSLVGSDSAAPIARPARPDFLRQWTRIARNSFSVGIAPLVELPGLCRSAASFRSRLFKSGDLFPRYADALSLASVLIVADRMHVPTLPSEGPWNHPDNKFTDAVLTSAAKDEPPNFGMPDDADGRSSSEARRAFSVHGRPDSSTSTLRPDAQKESRSTALSAASPAQFDGVVPSTSSSRPHADRMQDSGTLNANEAIMRWRDHGLLVRSLPELTPE